MRRFHAAAHLARAVSTRKASRLPGNARRSGPGRARRTPTAGIRASRRGARVLVVAMVMPLGTWIGAAPAGNGGPLSLADRLSARFDRAAAAREAGETGVARVLLDGLVVAPALPASARARAYYLRGESWYRDGLPLSAAQDYARALEFDRDLVAARYALGYLFLKGEGVDRDPAQAARQLARAAREGHPDAQYNIGLLHLEGRGVAADPDRGRLYLERAAAQDHAPALTALGRMLADGTHGEPDPERARNLLQRARTLGHAPAATGLGSLLEREAEAVAAAEPEAADALRAQALDLYRAGAEGGDGDAMTRLGWLHLQGVGVPADRAAARVWFERAAEAEHPRGTAFLAWLLETEPTPDLARAGELYGAAARLGEAHARDRLAELALQAVREPERRDRGLAWLRTAAEAGSVRAGNALAWIRATEADPALRDGREAVRFARRVVEAERSAAHLDTLAAAYAEAGDFRAAREAQQAAIEALDAEDEARWGDAFTERLARYRERRPWRDVSEDRRPDGIATTRNG
jgi:TPR repeat protein